MADNLWKYGNALEKPIVIAHRGGGLEAPENTYHAFSRLSALEVGYIETDVHSTKDGVAVVIHDPVLDRVSNGRGLVSHHTWDDVKKLRDHCGAPLMRLDETLTQFPDMVFNIDAKEDRVVEPLICAITQARAFDRVSLASFSERRLAKLRQRLPGTPSSLGVSAVAKLLLAAKSTGKIRSALLRTLPTIDDGVQAVQVPSSFRGIKIVDKNFIELAHERDWAVHVWTVNDERQARQLMELGVDGIITDIPTSIRNVL
ncbi:glycerophosphodiester phosphodiesterase [Arcanobacterium pinnipediorum]|uniref:Glycerophosphodiester phosphodiesterase n=1 Tax=Arcanobacterium pinnipediorum TaxID=1503041 RepID=A0ABY5AKH7_9ACTO|nr:glycerophosphodiester phosphodiesterase [Arcanobacterium pinnipediorum]USR79703.1 glycerophosphodiester phosphodiesterase [Arcanobacterium pinnipediorum]